MAEGDWAFSFNVTYQNHGPYFDDRLTSDTIYVPQGTLSDSDYYIINNYLTGVADTGARMRAFCDRFRDSEEPVVIVFFRGSQAVARRAERDVCSAWNCPGRAGGSGATATYLTDYLLWANGAAKKTLVRRSAVRDQRSARAF